MSITDGVRGPDQPRAAEPARPAEPPRAGEPARAPEPTRSPERRDTAPSDGQFDRTPPQDVAAEQCVLGGMLLSKDAIADVVEILRTGDFYRPDPRDRLRRRSSTSTAEASPPTRSRWPPP